MPCASLIRELYVCAVLFVLIQDLWCKLSFAHIHTRAHWGRANEMRRIANAVELASLRHLNEILSFRGWSTINRKQINSMLCKSADRRPIRMMKLLISRVFTLTAFFNRQYEFLIWWSTAAHPLYPIFIGTYSVLYFDLIAYSVVFKSRVRCVKFKQTC